MEERFRAMAQSILDGDAELAAVLAREAVEKGIDPLDALDYGFSRGIGAVGEQYSRHEMFLPDLVLAGQAMKAAIAVLEQEITRLGAVRPTAGRVVMGTVQGDVHDIGKSLVGTMLSTSGFQVYDLGVDVRLETFVERAQEVRTQIVGLSAMLTTTMVRQREIIQAFDDLGLRPGVKILVGGAPVTRSWADEIEADGYSEDAPGVVAVAKKILGA